MLIRGHSSSFSELNLPATVYKYRQWNDQDHRKVLTHAELRFSKPWDMCDQTELQYKIVTITGQELFNFYQDRAKKHFPNLNKHEQFRKANEEFKFSAYRKPAMVQTEVDKLFADFNNSYGALCLGHTSTNRHLWNVFGDDGSGFCVGLHPKKIIDDTRFFGGPVEYYTASEIPVMRMPSLEPDRYTEDIFNILINLPDDLRREDEYRIFKTGHGSLQVDKNAISEVIIGYDMHSNDEKELIEIVSENLPHATINKSILNGNGEITISTVK